MNTIRITDACIVRGVHAPVGSVHTLERTEAELILSSGRAVRYLAPVPSAAPEPVAVVTPEPAPAVERHTEAASAAPATEHAKPAPKKRAAKP